MRKVLSKGSLSRPKFSYEKNTYKRQCAVCLPIKEEIMGRNKICGHRSGR